MSELKPYPKYKDSGVKWIGNIPRDWEFVKLRYLVSSRKNSNPQDNLPYLGLENIESKTGKILSFNNDEIDGTSIHFFKNDVLFGKLRPYLAKVTLVDFEGHCSTEFIVLQSEKINNKYLMYLLLSTKFISHVNSSTYGTKMPRANWEFIKNTFIPIGTNEQQETIVSFLDSKTSQIDSLISDKERLIELLEEKRQAVITETVTKGLDPNVKMKDSGIEWIGDIPEHWDVSNLKYQSEIIMGQSIESDDVSLNISDLPFLQGNADFSELYPTPKNYCIKGKKHSKVGDILLSVRAPVGAMNISNQNYAIGRGLSAIRVYSNYIPYYWFALKVFKKELQSKMTGSTFEAVTIEDVKNLTFLTPTNEEMMEIGKVLDVYDKEVNQTINNIEIQITKLKEYRESLIYEAVTGKIDVRDYISETEKVH